MTLTLWPLFQPMAATARIANDVVRQAQEEAEIKVNRNVNFLFENKLEDNFYSVLQLICLTVSFNISHWRRII